MRVIGGEFRSRRLKSLPGAATRPTPDRLRDAEFDVLRDEGKVYADRLKNEGVPVHYICYEGMVHDFVVLPGLFDKAKNAINLICSSLRNVFYNSEYSLYFRN
jgi:hypothetical protein